MNQSADDKDKMYADVIKTLRKEMTAILKKGTVPGAAISLVTTDEVVWSEAFGYLDLTRSRLVDLDTIFHIASTSKTFTGAAFMLAVQEGLVELDDPLVKHYPEFRINSRFGAEEPQKITFRHLLSHRSGLPREPRIGGVFSRGHYTFEESIESLKDCWMVAPVGDRYWYSNIGMDLVAYSIQRVSGTSYPDFIREKLAMPLGITSIALGSIEAKANPNEALGTDDGVRQTEYEVTLDYGCGGVWISNTDMAKFVRFLLNKGTVDGKQVLREDLFKEMTTSQFVPEDGLNYGLGVDIDTGSNIRVLRHGGGSYGFASTMYWIPDHGIGVTIQANQEWYPGSKHPHTLGRKALELMLQQQEVEWRLPSIEDFLTEEEIPVDKSHLAKLTGVYVGLWNTFYPVVYKRGKLYTGRGTPMIPHNPLEFRVRKISAVRFNFDTPDAEEPSSMAVLWVNGMWVINTLHRVTPYQPEDEPVPLDAEASKQLTGIYKAFYYGSEPTFALAKIKGGQLFVSSNQGIVPAYAYDLDQQLFFISSGECVQFRGDVMWDENCYCVKWEDPISELKALLQSDPKHRLLVSWRLDQIAKFLKELGREEEAAEVKSVRKQLSKRKT